MKGKVSSGFAIAVVAATLVAATPFATAQEMSMLMRAARIHPGQTRAEALATMGMTPKTVENRRVAGVLDWETLRFEFGPVEVNVCLMFNRVVSVGQIVHREDLDRDSH